jgi:hypothetical protein
VPRTGPAFLPGRIVGGRCGARRSLRSSGPQGEYPGDDCTRDQPHDGQPRCQAVRALGRDAAIAHRFLPAREPDHRTGALAAWAEAEREATTLQRHWQLRRARAPYDVDRARRQSHLGAPENRLVARPLEHQGADTLRAQEEVEQTSPQWLAQQPVMRTESARQEIGRFGGALPAVWAASTTTTAERKPLIRLRIRAVLVATTRGPGRGWGRLLWQTGATSAQCGVRTVQRSPQHADADGLPQRVRLLTAAQKLAAEIAVILNAAGFRSARGRACTSNLVWRMRQQWHLPTVHSTGTAPNPLRWPDGTYAVEGGAAAVGGGMGTVYPWVRTGRIPGGQLTKGMPWKLPLTEEQIASLREYVHRGRRMKRSKKEAV